MNTDDTLLAELLDGTYQSWSPEKFEEVIDPDRIDRLRKLVKKDIGGWVTRVQDLLESDNADHVLMGHSIGRAVIIEFPEVRAAAQEAYHRWQQNPLLRLSLMHDLMEDEAWMAANRRDVRSYIEEHREDVRNVLLTYMKDDRSLVEVFVHRLNDVLSDNPQTMNTPSKVFVYILYLGLARGDDDRQLAADAINAVLPKLSERDSQIAATVLSAQLSG